MYPVSPLVELDGETPIFSIEELDILAIELFKDTGMEMHDAEPLKPHAPVAPTPARGGPRSPSSSPAAAAATLSGACGGGSGASLPQRISPPQVHPSQRMPHWVLPQPTLGAQQYARGLAHGGHEAPPFGVPPALAVPIPAPMATHPLALMQYSQRMQHMPQLRLGAQGGWFPRANAVCAQLVAPYRRSLQSKPELQSARRSSKTKTDRASQLGELQSGDDAVWELHARDDFYQLMAFPPFAQPLVIAISLARAFHLDTLSATNKYVWFKTWRIPDICVSLHAGVSVGYEVQLLAFTLVDECEGRLTVQPTPLFGATRQPVREDNTVEFRSIVFGNTSFKSAGRLFHLALEVIPPRSQAPPSTQHATLHECWLCEGVKVISKRVRADGPAELATGGGSGSVEDGGQLTAVDEPNDCGTVEHSS